MCYGSAEDADSTIATSPAAASSADASHAAKCHAVWNKHHDASCAAPSTTDDADGATNATNAAAKSTDDTDGTKPIATSTSSYATSVPWPLKFVVTENQVGSLGPISMNNFEKTADIDDFWFGPRSEIIIFCQQRCHSLVTSSLWHCVGAFKMFDDSNIFKQRETLSISKR